MKKLNLSIRSLFVLCLAAVSVAANAQQVSQEEAANIALQFLKGNGSQNSRLKKATPEALKLVYTEPSAKDKSANLYVYNMEGGGFAIVSADARTGSQILGYSFDNNFSAKGMPDNVKYWLGEYSRQIDYIKTHQPEVSESKRRERLKMEEGGYVAPGNVTIKVKPLLKTTWGQSAPYYGMTPTLEGQHTATGCVATAMAQIMNYWHWPAQGKGKHTYYWTGDKNYHSSDFSSHKYEWKNMADSYDETQAYVPNDDNMKAVAQLMYDCGVAVDMDYGLESSGAYDEDVVTALTSYFGYSHDISLRQQSETEFQGVDGNTAWIKLLTDELDESRPVYYAAEDKNDDDAHAFVLDGYGTYNSKTYFHINWGWDGYDGTSTTLDKTISNDGYFAMNSFDPIYRDTGNTDSFNKNSVAIIGIQPASNQVAFDELEEGWDADDKWIVNDNTITGDWQDQTAYYYKTELSFKQEQNEKYKSIYRIKFTNWNTEAGLRPVTSPNNKNLFFYWNSETNECYFPTQYTNLKNGQNYEYYYVNKNNSVGRYDPIREQFLVKFDVYEYSKPTATGYTLPWKDDPEGFFQSLMAAKTADDGFMYIDKSSIEHSYSCIIDADDEGNITYKLTDLKDSRYKNKNNTFHISDPHATLTLVSTSPDPIHRGLYLGDFNGSGNTATQVAGYYEYKDIEESSYYYSIGMMKVTENTTKLEISQFAQKLKDDYTETYGVGTELQEVVNGNGGEVTFTGIEEGAYYVVVAHYDADEKFTSYEYMPVFFSRDENWVSIDNDPSTTDVIDKCTYIDDIVYGALYTADPTELDDDDDNDVDVQERSVEVQQYKGGDLIKNTGDRIFRIKNPYGDYDVTYHNNPIDPNDIKNYKGEDTHRSDVYLYLYVDADNNVSLFPDYFEFQPLGLDWGRGEMMVKQNATGTYIETATESYDANTIVYDKSVENVFYDMEFAQYFIDGTINANWDDYRFELQLPSTLKKYLTLYDNEPYTNNETLVDTYNGIYYSRELDSNNNWGTLMLPFKFKTEDIDGFSFYELTEIETHDNETSALVFTQIAEDKTVEANTPVIFKRDAGPEKNLEVSGVVEDGFVDLVGCGETGGMIDNPISNLNDNKNWSFIGVYNSGAIRAPKVPNPNNNELARCYFFEGNEICNVDEAMYLYQYRGYFRDNSTTTTGAKRIPVRFNDEEYTSLDALFNGEQPVKKYGKGRFNLQGQAVGKDYKGVVIEDGRKKISY